MPKHIKRTPGASDADYFQGLGYKLVDDAKKPDTKRLETADEYVSRMSAMVLLYASIVQTESAGNPLPLGHGWTWLARSLNSMPPNRLVGCAGGLRVFGGGGGQRGGNQRVLPGREPCFVLPGCSHSPMCQSQISALCSLLWTWPSHPLIVLVSEAKLLVGGEGRCKVHAGRGGAMWIELSAVCLSQWVDGTVNAHQHVYAWVCCCCWAMAGSLPQQHVANQVWVVSVVELVDALGDQRCVWVVLWACLLVCQVVLWVRVFNDVHVICWLHECPQATFQSVLPQAVLLLCSDVHPCCMDMYPRHSLMLGYDS